MDNALGRAVRPRSRGTARARRAITLAVLTAGVWNVTASRAEADPAPIIRQYMCPLPIIGAQPMTVSVARPALDTATVGVPTPRLPISATGTVAAAGRMVVGFLDAKWAEGTVVVTGEVDTPQGREQESMPFTVPRTDVATGSGPLSVSGFGTLPSITFSRPGGGEVLATGLTLHISLLTSGGGQTFLSPFNITCALASGQSDAVATFRILPPPAASPSPVHGTATSSRTPRPTPSPTPSPLAISPAPPPSPAPTQSPRPPSLAAYLLWPAGIVAAGGVGGAAWWLLRRMSA
ncbi:MAG: DUF6801 domain-containing protein [Trebonia sp.]